MLIDRQGTVYLKDMTLNGKSTSDEILSLYGPLFRGTVFEHNKTGVLRSLDSLTDEAGNRFRVVLNFVNGVLESVTLYPLPTFHDTDTYPDLCREEERRRTICNRILQESFGRPDITTQFKNSYDFDACTITAWSSADPRDMCSGGCITVSYKR